MAIVSGGLAAVGLLIKIGLGIENEGEASPL